VLSNAPSGTPSIPETIVTAPKMMETLEQTLSLNYMLHSIHSLNYISQ
jgi:hypothetical protein